MARYGYTGIRGACRGNTKLTPTEGTDNLKPLRRSAIKTRKDQMQPSPELGALFGIMVAPYKPKPVREEKEKLKSALALAKLERKK